MNERLSGSPQVAAALAETLAQLELDPQSPLDPRQQKAVLLARKLQQRAAELQTPQERRQQMELDRLIQNPHDRATLTQLTDQAFRSETAHRTVDQIVHILDVQGVPRFFSPFERTLLKGFQSFGSYLPGVAVPLVKEKMRQETANVILPAEQEMLTEFLKQRRAEGIRMNVNYLGEALLGERQATQRLDTYLAALQLPEIEVLSVKISTIYSQISPLAREHTVSVLCDRLELLYRAAARETYTRADGTTASKFVYLDMEEYRDMELTAEAFMRTLDRPGLEQVRAGIALQAYLPDSFRMQKRINAWARDRVARGGSPVTLRIVKGANMEAERVEASIRGWPQAPFKRKVETDANYKRMLIEAMRPENLAAVHIGIASHNLFDIAFGLVLAYEQNGLDRVQFEMLEGMANHQRRALFEQNRNLLLYAPACRREEFVYAIGYLIRRLDENTGSDNFLRHAFKLNVGSEDWKRLEKGFIESFHLIESLPEEPRRRQDRHRPPEPPAMGAEWWQLVNEPDTDFALPQNSRWAEEIVERWKEYCDDRALDVPLVVGGEVRETPRSGERAVCRDPSRPGTVVGRFVEGTDEDAETALRTASEDRDGWRRRTAAERSAILAGVAQNLRVARADLLGAAMANGGKILTESDPEVSEAVDFVEFYRRAAEFFEKMPGLEARGKGVVVVVSPWNFPLAIPCGGIAAALAAGNNVILKPASDTVLIAYRLCECFWNAGVPRTALQFLPCPGSSVGQRMITDPRVGAVILTGGTATAETMLRAKPTLPLFAETGGKNATIVTAMSDRDQAIKNVIHSAFSHSGQKCSATSLLLLEEEVYEDPNFREALCDAVESLAVGSAWDLKTRVGPLIRPPRGDLERGLKELEPGESWAVRPQRAGDNPNLYAPGVKWGVRPGSYTHMTEFFGPLLGVMKFRTLNEAISIVNQTGYGLTSGLESLDDREHEVWQRGIRAGNLYINRPTTGAVVLRQPFGGVGKSSFGAGIKAGGPNYVAQFIHFEQRDVIAHDQTVISDALLSQLRASIAALEHHRALPAEDIRRLVSAIASYDIAAHEEFHRRHDHMRLLGQDNFRLYRPIRELRVRVDERDAPWEIFARVAAARAAGCRPTVSSKPGVHDEVLELLDNLTDNWAGQIEFVEESDEELAEAIRAHHTQRVRFASPDRVPTLLREAAMESGVYQADAPVLLEGRVELLWYVEEQSLSVNYHRYGNLGDRALEQRHEPD